MNTFYPDVIQSLGNRVERSNILWCVFFGFFFFFFGFVASTERPLSSRPSPAAVRGRTLCTRHEL